ncbi:CocE/NonD family hydrolase [Psychromicrobium sp. YIM B11713]|uniref:CocE/NonD family hydrolase n=1 Tax=Psychromicrobium sp. YIM B11713 TaxID=3145233 RepID=UPI00374E711D
MKPGRFSEEHWVELNDGALLATEVFFPEVLPQTVIFTRTPYDKSQLRAVAQGWTREGFVFVAQDVRGRYRSTGEWIPYRNELQDGSAAVDWIVRQPWSDGRVIASGASYGSFTAWGSAKHPSVCGVISEVPAGGHRRAHLDDSGILRLAEFVQWTLRHGWGRESCDPAELPGRDVLAEMLLTLPIHSVFRGIPPGLRGWGFEQFLDDLGLDEAISQCTVPTLHIGGWYDLFLGETLRQWSLAGSSAGALPEKRLVIGPWGHALSSPDTSEAGGRDHGPASQLALGPLQLAWAHSILDPAGPSTALSRGERVFMMAKNTWLEAWPEPESRELDLILDVDQMLRGRASGGSGISQCTYDLANPRPSLVWQSDRGSLRTRTDALYFRTETVEHGFAITGAPRMTLRIPENDSGGDWICHLNQILPDGKALRLCSGAGVVEPGVSQLTLELNETAIWCVAGSCLELELATGDFPFLARNLPGRDRYHDVAVESVTCQGLLTGAGGSILHLPISGASIPESEGAFL